MPLHHNESHRPRSAIGKRLMDAYATTILDTQESVLQQNIHPQVGCSSLPVNGVIFFPLLAY
jgi:hypothetical protein